jgi:hypothetical protein
MVAAVTRWADQEHVSLKTVTATDPDQFVSRIGRAIDLAPDLVICAGDGLVDPRSAARDSACLPRTIPPRARARRHRR